MKRKLMMAMGVIVLLTGGVMAVVSSTFDNAILLMKIGRYGTAKQKLEWLAIVGDTRAQLLLGEIYAYGFGVTRDRDEAIKWFRRAACHAKGLTDPAAYTAYYVGLNFYEGSMVDQDLVEAAWWFQFAKDGGITLPVPHLRVQPPESWPGNRAM